MKPATVTAALPFLMSGAETGSRASGPDWRHWTMSTALVGLLHAGMLSIAVLRIASPPPPRPPAIAIDLAPLPPPPPPPAPVAEPPRPPAPKPVETKPTPKPPPPRQTVKPAPAPTPHVPEAAPTPEAVESAPVEPVAPAPPPPSAAPAPAPASSAARQSAITSWQRALHQHLQSRKRYPRAAQSRRQEGVAVIRFVLDREGTVLSARLERSSGTAMLDEEALDLIHRTQPLPPPPAEITGERIEVTIPIEYILK